VLKSGVSQLAKRSPEVVLEPNKNYWNKDRTPKSTIVFDNVISKADALADLGKADGKIDVVTELTPKEAKDFKSDSAKIVEGSTKTILVGVFNQNKDGSPFKDAAVRKAMNMAIDKDRIVEKGVFGYGEPVAALIEEGRFGHNPDLKPYKFDAEKAKESLKAMEGKTLVIVASESQTPLVEALASELAGFGISLAPDYKGEVKDDWDIKLVEHFDWSPDFPVGVVHREFFGKDGGFRAMPEDPKFDEMYAKLLATTDPAEQEKLTQEIEAYVHDQANVLFLLSPNKLFAVRNGVNFTPYDTMMLELAETYKE
jgi:peptide/nickel transport system substrate-binding protein